ncbi:hypothetical protein D3C87_1837660 [compost metagenome]
MDTNESHSFDTSSGIPKVTPDDIRAFKSQPNFFDDEFKDLQHDNPELAREIFIDAHNTAKSDMDKKRAYAAGALFVYGLWLRQEQDKVLGSFPDAAEISDGDVGEAPQP